MTRVKNSSYFLDKPDHDVIESLLSKYDLAADVADTQTVYEQLVQYDVTDWDFCLLRASVNGQLLFAEQGKITSKPPSLSGDPKVVLQFGSSILELDAEVDARDQHKSLKALIWDPVNQQAVEAETSEPALGSSGNLDPQQLAASLGDDASIIVAGEASESESQAFIDGQWTLSQLNQIGARIKCEGMTEVNVADVVQLDGIGERFSGKAFVTALRHDFDLVKGWKTTLQIGGVKQIYQDSLSDLGSAGGYRSIAKVHGLSSGLVISNEDPSGEFRVQVALPMVGLGEEGVWARVSSMDAGDARGTFFRPEVGDEVLLGYLQGDPRSAVVLGMLHSSANASPFEPSDDNHEKGYVSRAEMKIVFDDDQVIMNFETPAGNSIRLDEAESAMSLVDQNGNSIVMNSDGIKIESGGNIEIVAGNELAAQSGTQTKFEAGTELKLESTAGSALSSSAVTKVEGSLVQIN